MKEFIEINKFATENCAELEQTINEIQLDSSAKMKADFGNLVIMLKGFRMISEATEAILSNNGIVKTNNNEYYKKIEEEEEEGEEGNDTTARKEA